MFRLGFSVYGDSSENSAVLIAWSSPLSHLNHLASFRIAYTTVCRSSVDAITCV